MVSEVDDERMPPPAYDSTAESVQSEAAESQEGDYGQEAHHGLASLKAQPGSHHHFSDVEVL